MKKITFCFCMTNSNREKLLAKKDHKSAGEALDKAIQNASLESICGALRARGATRDKDYAATIRTSALVQPTTLDVFERLVKATGLPKGDVLQLIVEGEG